jgi:hypothetical protein
MKHEHDQATSRSNAIVADTVPAQRVGRGLRSSTASVRQRGARFVLSATVLVSLLLGLLGAATWANAQSLSVPVALPQQLLTGMRARVAVSIEKRSGRTIPAYHCRHAPGGCDQRLSAFAGYLVSAANRTKLDPWLLAAMAFKESGFNPFALGSLGEMGILQINPERRDAREVRFMRDEWYRKRCRREPGACQQEVVDHAAQVLSRSFEKCGSDLMDALGAYNTGRCGGNDRYAKRVLTERAELMRAAGLQTPELSFRSIKRRPRG